MPIDFTCPHCGKQMSVADQFAGQTGPCSNCGQTIAIPGKPVANYAPAQPARGSGMSIGIILVVLLGGGLLCAGILAALLLPAIQAAREAARRMESMNNMRQISLALHNYHDTFQSFPPAVVTDAEGKPLYSGRVLLLPYLEQAAIYNAWNKDKAWDSPENRQFASTVLKVFEDPSAAPGNPGRTDYLFLTGKGSMMDMDAWQENGGLSFRDVTDGLSNTVYLVEIKNGGAQWAQPKDLDISQVQNGLPRGNHPGGNLVGMADGSVRFVADSAAPTVIQALSTRAGDEVVGSF